MAPTSWASCRGLSLPSRSRSFPATPSTSGSISAVRFWSRSQRTRSSTVPRSSGNSFSSCLSRWSASSAGPRRTRKSMYAATGRGPAGPTRPARGIACGPRPGCPEVRGCGPEPGRRPAWAAWLRRAWIGRCPQPWRGSRRPRGAPASGPARSGPRPNSDRPPIVPATSGLLPTPVHHRVRPGLRPGGGVPGRAAAEMRRSTCSASVSSSGSLLVRRNSARRICTAGSSLDASIALR